MFFLKLIFQDEGHLYANCSFYILAFYCKCLLSESFCCGIRMHLRILTVVHFRLTNGHILLKNVLLKLNFQVQGHFYANCLFYNFLFCLKCLLFHFFSRGIRMHIPILIGVQKSALVVKQMVIFF